MSYQDFLATKAKRHQSPGVTIDPADIHPSLHDWQKRIVAQALSRAGEIQEDLWDITVLLAQEGPRSVPVGLFIETLNDLIDDSEKRTAAFGNRVPQAVIVLLFAVAGVAMALIAYRCGLTGHRRLGLNALFALLIAVVITIILDIDRPRSGLVHVSQASMERLQESLQNGAPEAAGLPGQSAEQGQTTPTVGP